MPSTEPDPRDELRVLAAALAAHADWQQATGASGLPAATAEIARARRGPDDALPDERPPGAGTHALSPSPPASPRSDAPRAATATASLPAAIVDPTERKRALDLIAAQVSECAACGLHSARKQAVFARGIGSSGLCFVGEGPGAEEDEQGLPFVGAAGQLLDKMIEAMGFSRDEVYVANIVKCRPPNNRKPAADEMAECVRYLEQQIAVLNPEVIVALGATAVQGLLGTTEGITRLRGKWKLYKGRIAVMPTFHPAYLLRTPSAKREVWTDLQSVLRQMGRSVPEPKKG